MEEVWKYLKDCGVFYFATAEGDQPRVRPLHAVLLFEERLYIRVGKEKGITRQLLDNPRCELCAFSGQDWLRITARALPSEDPGVLAVLQEQYPLRPGDGTPQAFCLCEGTAVLAKYAELQKTIHF